MHKLYKILYFAEKDHLAEYGRPITGDEYIAMEYGPVPSFLRDAIKSVSKENPFYNSELNPKEYFEVIKYFVGAKKSCDIDYLSESDIECLQRAIEKIKNTDFAERTKMSHDEAYEKGKLDIYNQIDPLEMASSNGASFDMLKYIQSNMENQNSFSCR